MFFCLHNFIIFEFFIYFRNIFGRTGYGITVLKKNWGVTRGQCVHGYFLGIIGHILVSPSPIGYMLTSFDFFINFRNIPSIILKRSIIFMYSWNFNWLFLKLNQFMCKVEASIIDATRKFAYVKEES